MATLVLSAVGTIVGGPIGGAIGAFVGQQIDGRVFAPKGRKGPRLNELSVQTSAYGSTIPKLFGTSRVAGTVIWATDLKETKRKVSNGKGQPKSTVYSYSASFAVALSARAILRVGRIWADGNLLRGAAGDFKTETGFRLHTGHERQSLDPLIASAQGMATTPAYRGLAYAVFEDFQLGDYGNRIPSLSFEVVADEGEVALGDVVGHLSGGAIEADWPDTVGGLAVTGESFRGLVETFAVLAPVYARESGQTLQLRTTLGIANTVFARDLGASHGGEASARIEIERRPVSTLPPRISVAHYDPARDYQQGLQRADGIGGTGRELRIDLPATLAADAVKGRAVGAARRGWSERTTARIHLPWRALALTTASAIRLPGDMRTWRVAAATLERMTMVVDLVLHASSTSLVLPSDGGGGVPQPDLVHGPTSFHLLDLPPLDDSVANGPRIAVAAAGASPGWRRAALLLSSDGGTSWQETGATAAPAIMGTALTALAPASAALRDMTNTVDVELLSPAMTLANASIGALDVGANAAMLGNEIMQFETAQPIGPRRYRLSGFLRGRRGTEWAMSAHVVGDRFVILENEALAPIEAGVGASIRVMAVGVADPVPPIQMLTVTGEAVRPLSVAGLSAERLADGDTEIRWIRRSRNGWRWLDGADAPLVEENERYRLTFTPDAGAARAQELTEVSYLYTAAARAADAAAGVNFVSTSVAQLGIFGASRPCSLIFSIL